MNLREQMIEVERSKCRHFNGTVHETCAAGVNYRALVGGSDLGWVLRLPCGLRRAAGREEDIVPCEQRAVYTDEELGQRADAAIQQYDNLALAMKACRADASGHGLKKGHGGTGFLKCPCCPDGTLRYSVASVNGHLWGACTTVDCVRWMQ